MMERIIKSTDTDASPASILATRDWKEWVEKTGAIGLKATTGRYGGTFAHPDIAFEFGMWIVIRQMGTLAAHTAVRRLEGPKG